MTRTGGLALMAVAPVLWSTAGVVTRHIERATPFELVFWRSLFAFLFVALALLALRRNPLKMGWPGVVVERYVHRVHDRAHADDDGKHARRHEHQPFAHHAARASVPQGSGA